MKYVNCLCYGRCNGRVIHFHNEQDIGVVIMSSSEEQNDELPPGPDALTRAAARGETGRVRELLDAGVHPDATNKYGRTAIQTMTYTRPEIARMLLEKGANPNVRDPDVGRTPLHDAVAYGTPATVMCLLQGGADAMIAERLFGNTPVHIAAEEGREQMLQPLASCSSFRERNTDGKTPYGVALANNHQKIAHTIQRFHRSRGLRLDHQCRLKIRRTVNSSRLRRLRELEPLVSPKLTRYLMLDEN